MTLTELANRAGTDKGTVTAAGHGYTLVYDLLFGGQRDRIRDICEIGLARGGPEVAEGAAERDVADVPSVRMWHDYFPEARLVGVDISDCSSFSNDWFTFVQADCGDPEQLNQVSQLGRTFDLIVDDGSHASFHQQLTLLKLFPVLRAGGLYVIEDLHWQPETYADSLPKVPRTDILLERFQRSGALTQTGALPSAEWAAIGAQIEAIYLFDDEWLAAHRRLTNVRGGAIPEFETRIDRRDAGRRPAKGLLGEALRLWRGALHGREHAARYPAVKLAVIRKAAA